MILQEGIYNILPGLIAKVEGDKVRVYKPREDLSQWERIIKTS